MTEVEMRRQVFSIAIAAALLGAACQSSSYPPPPPPADATIAAAAASATDGTYLTSSLASIQVGVVLILQIDPTQDAGTISLTVDDPTVVLLAPTVQADQFMLAGRAPGQTTLHVFLNGAETHALSVAGSSATSLPLEVTAQPPPT
jgi:hypothetical protein